MKQRCEFCGGVLTSTPTRMEKAMEQHHKDCPSVLSFNGRKPKKVVEEVSQEPAPPVPRKRIIQRQP